MQHRSDALGAAARLVVDAHDVARSLPGAVATIGRLTVAPGATNTIPERAELFADLRAPDDERVEALVEGVTAAAHAAAAAARCEVVVEQRWRYEAVAMSDPPRAALQRAVAALGVEPVELPSGAGHDAAILALAGVPSAMLFVRSDAGGVSHAPEEATGIDAVVLAVQRARGRVARAGRRVIDWDALARPSLRGLVRYDPGQSRDSIRAQLGLDALEPLHWNEDRFEPPRHVLEAAAAEVFNAALYPEHLFADFREGLSRWLGVPAECLTPAHGAQALIATLAQVFVGPGTPVVVPNLTYGLYAAVCAAAGGVVTRVPPAGLAIDLDAVATAAIETDARLVWICDPNNPTGTLIEPDAWSAFLDRLPDGCIVIADETYIDFADPAVRVDRRRDVLEGRPGDRHPLVLQDPRAGRAARRLRDLGSRGRAAARPRAGAVQRQPRRARRRHRGSCRSRLRRPAARRGRSPRARS